MDMDTKQAKGPGGRPTEYRPEYCQMVIDHMKNGKSIAAFAAAVGVSRKTIWKWGKEYPEFGNACDVAKEFAQIWFETLAILIATGQHKIQKNDKGKKIYANANHGMVMFLMSRRFPDYYNKNRNIIEDVDSHKAPGEDDGVRLLTREERRRLIDKHKKMIEELEDDYDL